MLIKNMKVLGSRRPRQVKENFIFTGLEKPPISYSELRNHFISEAKNMIYHRKNNDFGYPEKWLHSLLIEKMQDGTLSGLDLEFLYYETPVGKVKRNKQFGREKIDILAKERHSKAMVVVEVKKQGEDLNSAVSQGLSYVGWLEKYKEELKPRIAQLGWDANIENLKLIMLAPDMISNNTKLDATVSDYAKKFNCEVKAVYINLNWETEEDISVKGINTLL